MLLSRMASAPVSASSADQTVPVKAFLDQLLLVTLEWLAQSLQFIVPEEVPAGFTGCDEHSNRLTYSRRQKKLPICVSCYGSSKVRL